MVESDGGRRSVVFKGEDMTGQAEVAGPLSDTWKIDSSILQCKVRNGAPIRLGKGMLVSRIRGLSATPAWRLPI